METLVSLAVMTILMAAAYSTIQESLKLHEGAFQDSARIAQRCDLADRITKDFRKCTRIRAAPPGKWTLSLPDGSEVEYSRDKKMIVRNASSNAKADSRRFDVGNIRVWFRSKGRAWLAEVPAGNQPTAMRIQFSDSELIIAQ